jgi:hypothetical protein
MDGSKNFETSALVLYETHVIGLITKESSPCQFKQASSDSDRQVHIEGQPKRDKLQIVYTARPVKPASNLVAVILRLGSADLTLDSHSSRMEDHWPSTIFSQLSILVSESACGGAGSAAGRGDAWDC